MRKRTKKDPIDSAIEQAYYRLAVGRQINVMKISDLFRDCRLKIAFGFPVDIAVGHAIERYCEPVKP